MTVFEMASKYYPRMWSIERLQNLVKANKLTADEYKKITGEDYSEK